MATSIVDTYSGGISGETRQASLNASKIVRKLNWGISLPHATGTKLCVGIRYMLKGTANVTGSPEIALGLCNGDDADDDGNILNAYGDATTNHAIGAVTKFASFTYNAGPPAYFTTGGNNAFDVFDKVDTTRTDYGPGGFTGGYAPGGTGSGNVRGFFGVQLSKTGAGTWEGAVLNNSTTGGAQTDLTDANFNTLMTANFDSVSGLAGYQAITTYSTINADESADGNLDCVFCHWNKTAADIIVCDIAVTRIS